MAALGQGRTDEGGSMKPSRKPTIGLETEPILESVLAASRDSFRTLLARVASAGTRNEPTRLLFVSTTADCGSTTVAACAAIAIARDGSRPVRFIEANIYRPAAAGYLEVQARPGLVDVASGEAELKACIRTSPFHGLSVVTAGGGTKLRRGALGNARIHEAIANAIPSGDVTVIDGPPVLENSDACSLARHATEVLLVARAGRTSKKEIGLAMDLLNAADIKPTGVYLSRYRRTRLFGIPIGR